MDLLEFNNFLSVNGSKFLTLFIVHILYYVANQYLIYRPNFDGQIYQKNL